jgi:predicted nucleotidyltransferase component of viral defense system
LTVVVEANVTERQPYNPVVDLPFEVPYQGAELSTQIRSFDVHEMLGTKMRALFQRRRGRDLFDLYWALTLPGATPVAPTRVIEAFQHYMALEGTEVPRQEFLEQLKFRLADRGFCSDMEPLLRMGLRYNPQAAGNFIRDELLMRLPA